MSGLRGSRTAQGTSVPPEIREPFSMWDRVADASGTGCRYSTEATRKGSPSGAFGEYRVMPIVS
jgi:hypothetical protein